MYDPSEDLLRIVAEFLHLRRHVESMPREMIDARSQFVAMSKNGKGRTSDVALFYRLGGVLHSLAGPTMSEISDALNVPQSTATRLVEVLVAAGHAERLIDPEDRRIVRVTLTENGREMYRVVEDHIKSRLQWALCELSAEEQIALVSLLRKVLTGLGRSYGSVARSTSEKAGG